MDATKSTTVDLGKSPSTRLITVMGILYLILAALLVYTLAAFWPGAQRVTPQLDGTRILEWDPKVTWFGATFALNTEARLLWLAVIAGALGSYIHAVTSFASYVGNQRFNPSWLWWYLLRPPIGVALALVFYFVVRGGLLSSGAVGSDVSPFGVAALSGLVGMFSKQAADKLSETFDNLFRTEQGDKERRHKLQGAAPLIIGIEPKTVPAEGKEVELTLKGANFTDGAKVLVNGQERITVFRSGTEIMAILTAKDAAEAGRTLTIRVRGGPPSMEQSNEFQLRVTAREQNSND